jgi:hypothetical protein
LQVKPHLPFVHAGWPLAGGGQALPHIEQFFASLVVSEHEPLHSVGAVAGQPDAQLNDVPVLPGTHVGVAPVHVVEHVPQWVGDERSVSQPVSGLPSQSA